MAMVIYSLPDAATAYSLSLPEISRDYWIPESKLIENEFIATSTASAGWFRQLVKYDVSSIKKSYQLLLDLTRASTLQSMLSDTAQTSFYARTGSTVYEVNLIGTVVPAGKLRALANIEISVISEVSQ